MSTNTILYVTNDFVPNPTDAQQSQYESWAADLASSGFTTLIFYNLHIDAFGNFRYTNSQYPLIADGKLQKGYEYLPGLLGSITAAGKVQNIFFCLGGWGSQGDYLHAGQVIGRHGINPGNPLVANFVALQGLGVSGIDMDLETGGGPYPFLPYSSFFPAVVQLTTMLFNLHLQVTYCPYTQNDFWVGCLAAAYGFAGVQPVSWLNLQCYAGGTQAEWVGYLNESGIPLGIQDTGAFVVPGYSTPDTCPSALQSSFGDSSNMAAGVNAGFLWNYNGILAMQQGGQCTSGDSTADYANAIVAGLAELTDANQPGLAPASPAASPGAPSTPAASVQVFSTI